jgi:exosome complex component RRP42
MPLTVTYYKIDKYLIVDPTLEEEVMSDGRFTVASDGENIVALQKGSGYFTPEEVDLMINNTISIVKDLKIKVLEMVKTPAGSLML